MRYWLLLLVMTVGMVSNAQVQVKRLMSAESRFRQTRRSVMLERLEVREGTFRFFAPDSVCWKYDGMENVRMPRQMLLLVRQAVSGNVESVKKNFKVSWRGENMILIPQKSQMKRFFVSITISFEKEGVAKRVKIDEPNGDYTEIEFLNLKYKER